MSNRPGSHFIAILLISTCGIAASAIAQDHQSTVAVEGVVVDATTNEAVAGVRVQITSGGQSVISDADGHFVLQGISAGSHVLETQKAGYSPARSKSHRLPGNAGFPILAGRNEANKIEIFPAPLVTGRVTDDMGRPVQGVRVIPFRSIFDENGVQVPKYYPAAITNDLGEYRSRDWDAGEYRFRFEAPTLQRIDSSAGFFPTYYPGTTDEQKAVPITLQSGVETTLRQVVLSSSAGGVLHVRIVNEIRAPESGTAMLYLKRRAESTLSQSMLIALPADRVDTRRLSAGTYNVEVYFPKSAAWGRAQIDIQNEDVSIEIRLQKQVEVSGHILLKRPDTLSSELSLAPIEGLHIRLVDPNQLRGIDPELVSGVGGTLTPTPVSPGIFPRSYHMHISSLPPEFSVVGFRIDDQLLDRDIVLVRDGHHSIDVVLEENQAKIEGVVLGTDGQPLSGAIVVLLSDAHPEVPSIRTAATDAAGEYRLDAPLGKYHIYAWNELDGQAYKNPDFMKAYEHFGQTIELAAGVRRRRIDINAIYE